MASPLVKWAGGKRQLLPEIKSRMPLKFNRYFEPFFGGGALYFEIEPRKAIINDFNNQLVNLYRQVKECPEEVANKLSEYQNQYNEISGDDKKTEYYYERRTDFNSGIVKSEFTTEMAALFVFLNKAGFNGLYRVNSGGLFNVPPAHRKTLKAYDEANIYEVSRVLKNCNILCGDFEEACKGIRKGDFVFFDSPYYDTFDTYQAGGFSEKDHIRLKNLFKKLSNRGVYCILTNNDCDFIKELYKEYYIDVVAVKRMINCDGNNRTGSEVIITNFIKEGAE